VSADAPFEPAELGPGLWRWTAPHPNHDPHAAPGSEGDWGPEVASALYLEGDSAAFIDAQLPPDEAGFWTWADARTAGASRVAALTTIGFHRRSREWIVERYDASTSRARDRLPAGVEAVALRGAGEVAYWLPRPRALVVGDRLLGDDAGGLRLCPESWISYLGDRLTLARLRELLRPLLDLDPELILVSHGEPVLGGGRVALARAIS
jgi:glyoxylase-like metal-dependent hydrolase (beta-lactamase superfamily II)